MIHQSFADWEESGILALCRSPFLIPSVLFHTLLFMLALRATTRGGTVVLAGIHMSEVPPLDYTADLFNERDLRTVTANTRADGLAFLRLAERLGLAPTVREYPFSDLADGVEDLRRGRARGSLVMVC